MTFKHSIVLGVTASLLADTVFTDVKIGFIGSLSSGTGLSTLRGTGIIVGEINAVDGINGEKLVLVSTDTGEGVTEGVKTYEYLAETEEVDSVVSRSTDDVSLGRLPRMQESQIPTLDTWTSYIGIIDMIAEDPEVMAPYLMNIASDRVLAILYINFDAGVLKKEMGWDSVVILVEDTAFDEAITGPITGASGPVAGIGTKEIITYDVDTIDFAPLFSKAQALGADFAYQVGSVNSQVTSSQYVKLQVSMMMTGVNVSAPSLEYQEDIDGADDGISTLSPIPSIGFELDLESQESIDTHQTKYDGHPEMPHFNGFNAY